MSRNWLKTGLLLATLAAIPMVGVWAQPSEHTDEAESRDYGNRPTQKDEDQYGHDERRPGKRHGGKRFEGGRKPMPRHGESNARKYHRPHDDHFYDDGFEGDRDRHDDERVGPSHDRRGRRMSPPGRRHPRGPQGHNPQRFNDRDRWQRGERPRRRSGMRRGGEFQRGPGGRRDWNDTGPRPGRFREEGRFQDQDSSLLNMGGTVTTVVADNSIGVKADDGSSFWAKLPDSEKNLLRVGQRVELKGRWQDRFFVVDNVRAR